MKLHVKHITHKGYILTSPNILLNHEQVQGEREVGDLIEVEILYQKENSNKVYVTALPIPAQAREAQARTDREVTRRIKEREEALNPSI